MHAVYPIIIFSYVLKIIDTDPSISLGEARSGEKDIRDGGWAEGMIPVMLQFKAQFSQ